MPAAEGPSLSSLGVRLLLLLLLLIPAKAAERLFPLNNHEFCGGLAHNEMLADEVSEVDSIPV